MKHVKLFEQHINEGSIKYVKGKEYQTGNGWTVWMMDGGASFDIKVNNSAAWSTDPHDDRRQTLRLMDAGKKRATLTFKEGNIDKFAKQMHDLSSETTWGEKEGLTAKDYADIIRVWIEMGMEMNESESLQESHEDLQNYMFFSNLESIKRKCESILAMDFKAIDELLNAGGHDWAADHITVAKENIDQVENFLVGQFKDAHQAEPELPEVPTAE